MLTAQPAAQWRADDLNAVVEDGQAVAAWVDGVGGLSANATGQPVLVRDALATHSVVRFESSNGGDLFRVAAPENPLRGTVDFSVAVVFATATRSLDGGSNIWFQNTGLVDGTRFFGATTDWGIVLNTAGQVGAGLGGPPTTVYSSATALNDGNAHVALYTRRGGTLSLYVDTQAADIRTDGGTLPLDTTDITFGSLQSGALPYAGDIAEVRFYREALAAEDVQVIAAELIDTYTNLAPPTVADDHYVVAEDSVLAVTANEGLLANDTDIDHDPFVAELVDAPRHGSVSVASDGSFTYEPPADFFGEDFFTYLARDADRSPVAGVRIEVQPRFDAAHAVDDRYVVAADRTMAIEADSGVLANDLNPDRGELSAELVDDVGDGRLTLRADGSFDYDPVGFSGTTSFRYRVVDAQGGQSAARVTLDVDTPPVAQPDQYDVTEDVALRIDIAGGLLANDRDAEGDALQALLVSPPAHGRLRLAGDGSFTYEPATDFNGTDRFVYQATDGDQTSEAAAVTLNVQAANDRPVALPDRYSARPGEPLTVAADRGVLANDHDVDDTRLSALLIEGPDTGELEWPGDGSFIYRPPSDFSGSVRLRYVAADRADRSHATTVWIDVITGEVVIDELMAVNTVGLRDADGDTSDWLELVNRTPDAIDLGGWYLTDDPRRLTKWRFPGSVLLPPGERLVVLASGKDRIDASGLLHTNFRLAGRGEYVAVVRPDGVTVSFAYAPAFPAQQDDVAYGPSPVLRHTTLAAPDRPATFWVPTDARVESVWQAADFVPASEWASGPGVRAAIGFDRTEQAAPTAGIRIRDVESATPIEDLDQAESLLTEEGPEPGILGGRRLSETEVQRPVVNFGSGQNGHFGDDQPFPNAVANQIRSYQDFVIQARGSLLLPDDAAGRWTMGVRSDGGFRLRIDGTTVLERNESGEAVDRFTRLDLLPGQHAFELLHFDRDGGPELEWFAAPGWFAERNDRFRLVGDVAAGGLAVTSLPVTPDVDFGPWIATDVGDAMAGVGTTVYLRVPLTVEGDPRRFSELGLDVQYSDGFVAYLNGVEVARRNAPEPAGTRLSFDAAATVDRDDRAVATSESIDISAFLEVLRPGANVLALQGLNAAGEPAASTDFLLRPRLTAGEQVGTERRFLPQPTPGRPNGPGVLGLIGEVEFSSESGYYTDPLMLSLSVDTLGAQIRYTTDGSEPTATRGRLYTGPFVVDRTTVVRAVAMKDDFHAPRAATRTYLFTADIVRQSPDGRQPLGWPRRWGANAVDYGMDPRIVDDPRWRGQLDEAFVQIPSLSLVTPLENLFDPATGIYANANNRGRGWERPATLELIQPDGSQGFRVGAGVRIRGGFSRSTGNPKHSFRFFFRNEYGDGKLRFPLFGDEGASTFDSVDLRTSQNYSWSFSGSAQNTFVRDEFSRLAQGAMGQPYTRGRYYHLFINGQYWGLYQTDERPEASFAASYFGGAPEDYDAVKVVREGNLDVEATDGNLDAFFRLYDATIAGFSDNDAYFRVQGLNPDGVTRNASFERLLDVDNLIDTMILTYYTGDRDGPGSRFTAPRPNNMFGLFNREAPDGFKWFEHDSEHSLDTGATNMVQPLVTQHAAFNPENRQFFNPHWLHEVLMENAEYRLRFADRVLRHFGEGGALSEQASLDRVNQLAGQIDRAIVAESARWGDAKTRDPLTKSHWRRAVQDVRQWIRGRNAVVVQQLRDQGWYPAVDAPTVTPGGGAVFPETPILLGAQQGTIYYTLDGSDPRLPGGAVSPGAAVVDPTDPSLRLARSATLKARTLSDGQWSPLREVPFTLTHPLRISEVHYHPAPSSAAEKAAGFEDADDFEFIELVNVGDRTIPLDGVRLVQQTIDGRRAGVAFDFAAGAVGQLAPGERLLVVEDTAAFQFRYGSGLPVAGQWKGRLGNEGERLTLRDGEATIAAFEYSNQWHPATDGGGASLEIIDATLADVAQWGRADRWQASTPEGGTPGRPAVPGDFRGNGGVGADDIDLIARQVLAETHSPTFDLTGDGRVDRDDVRQLVEGILGTVFGDTDLDGDVDQTDLAATMASFTGPSGITGNWSAGDFDGDRDVDNLDLLAALANYSPPAAARGNGLRERAASSQTPAGR